MKHSPAQATELRRTASAHPSCDGAGALPRYDRYRSASLRSRSLSFALVAGIYLIVGLLFLVRLSQEHFLAAEPAPLVRIFDVAAAPRVPPREMPDGPEQIEKQQQSKPKNHTEQEARDTKRPQELVAEAPLVQTSSLLTLPSRSDSPAAPAAEVPETTAPKSAEAPPARRVSSTADATWEAMLLARLEAFRRYPASARARRTEGVVIVRFGMRRDGGLVSAGVLRSSGSATLDQAALSTVKRAAPFPPPPEERRGDPVVLDVPVEFFLM